jgi:hypothetical protein
MTPKTKVRLGIALSQVFVTSYRLKGALQFLRDDVVGPPFFHHRGGPLF